MIPFWPQVGMGQDRLIDYTIATSENGNNPATKVTKEEVERCIEALRKRDAMVEEMNVDG